MGTYDERVPLAGEDRDLVDFDGLGAHTVRLNNVSETSQPLS